MEVARMPESAADLNDEAVRLQAEGKYREAEELYQKSLAMLESTVGPDDPLVAQSLANRAALYREMCEHHDEAERIFQIAQRIWIRKGFPKDYQQPLWSEQIDNDRMLRSFGAQIKRLREGVAKGDPGARAEMAKTLDRLGPWYHNVEFAPGIMSNPSNADYPASRWRVLDQDIPTDLCGKSVLDIGCNSGFFSLEMKKRGAARVVGVDIMPHLLAQSRFASHWFGLPLELYECGAYDVRSLESKFDIVVFIGVLYHLKHPLYALEQISSICNEAMYFQSAVRGPLGDIEPLDDYPAAEAAVFDQPAWPKLYFIEKKFNGDESNWWFATRSCLKAMVRTSGFGDVQDTSNPEIFVCKK
jgi:tRNA (mo5U34)-methyltransferase